MKRTLRLYQKQAIECTMTFYQTHPGGGCYYALPTGTGKTRILSGLIEQLSQFGRVLSVAHRQELINQNAAAIRDDAGIDPSLIGIIMADRKEYGAHFAVGSVQTLKPDVLHGWLHAIETPVVAILVDECHHVTSKNTYKRIIDQVRETYPAAVAIGCTATPYRSDNDRMQEVLEECVFTRSIPDMQEEKWLSPVAWKRVQLNRLDLSSVKVGRLDGEKDYNQAELFAAISPLTQEIVQKTEPYLEERPTIVFACSVDHAHELAQAYRQAGRSAGVIWGEMPKEERVSTLAMWKRGELQIVCNFGVLTEGFDYTPQGENVHGLSAMVIARPTLSPSLYLQMLGRGTRLKPNRSLYRECRVFDVSGNANLLESKQICVPKVLPSYPEDLQEQMAEDDDFIMFGEEEEEEEEEGKKQEKKVCLTDPHQISWVRWGVRQKIYYGKFSGFEGPEVYIALIPDAVSGLYEGRVISREKGQLNIDTITAKKLPLIELVHHCNLLIAKMGIKKLVDKNAKWRFLPATVPQINFLRKLNPAMAVQAEKYHWTRGQLEQAISWEKIKHYVKG